MTRSLTSTHTFMSIEQLDEVVNDMGWLTEYRQLQPGSFSSAITILEGDSWFLLEEQSSRTVEVQAPAPDGMYMLALVKGDPATINGQTLSSDHILVQGPESDLHGTLSMGIQATQIGVVADRFEEAVAAMAPELMIPRAGAITIATPPGRLAYVRRAMRQALRSPSHRVATREEVVSRILANLIIIAADHGRASIGRSLHRPIALLALSRAREYIDSHLREAIRITSVCHYAGTNLRTLERIFARELGMTPQQYVRARRLNAVRQRLLATDRGQSVGVTDIAVGHGFSHLGRFAGDYYRHFGEYPRQTLKGR